MDFSALVKSALAEHLPSALVLNLSIHWLHCATCGRASSAGEHFVLTSESRSMININRASQKELLMLLRCQPCYDLNRRPEWL